MGFDEGTKYRLVEPGRVIDFSLCQLGGGKMAVDSGGQQMVLGKDRGSFRLEKFGNPWRKDERGEIVVFGEPGVRNVHLEVNRPNKGGSTVWYDQEKESGFSFWGIAVKMLLEGNSVVSRPTVMIRPGFDPGRVLYTAPSMWPNGSIFSGAWELAAQVGNPQVNLPRIEDHLSVKHEFGGCEELDIVLERFEGWQVLSIARKVDLGLRRKFPESVRKMFASTSLVVSIPVPFPLGLVEIGELPGDEDERARVLISHFQAVSKLLQGILPFK